MNALAARSQYASRHRVAGDHRDDAGQQDWERPRSELDEADRALLTKLCRSAPQLAAARRLAQAFLLLVRARGGAELGGWVADVHAKGPPELRGFARNLGRDWAAVQAGLTVSWSSGPVEGHINRVKLIKRAMFGRARFDLLRRRVLLAC